MTILCQSGLLIFGQGYLIFRVPRPQATGKNSQVFNTAGMSQYIVVDAKQSCEIAYEKSSEKSHLHFGVKPAFYTTQLSKHAQMFFRSTKNPAPFGDECILEYALSY